MKITTRLSVFAVTLGLTAAQSLAQFPGHKATLSIALTIHEEVGAFPATAAQKQALETKLGGYYTPVNPLGYMVPLTGLQYYAERVTPVGTFTTTPTTDGGSSLSGTYISDLGRTLKKTAYTNSKFLNDAVKAERLTVGQATGAKLVAIRLTGNYDERRIYIFAEGAKAGPGPFFIGILDDRDLYDSSASFYSTNVERDPSLLIVGTYGVAGYGAGAGGVTSKRKVVLANNSSTLTSVSAGGTIITGINLNFFPNDTQFGLPFSLTGPLKITSSLSSVSKTIDVTHNQFPAATRNITFLASSLIGSGTNRGANNTITGNVVLTAEIANSDLGNYIGRIPAGPGGLLLTR